MTFEQLSVPWSWDGSYARTGHGWFGGPCPSQAIHDCVPPWIDAPVSEVPEPSGALLLAFGLIAVYLTKRKRQ